MNKLILELEISPKQTELEVKTDKVVNTIYKLVEALEELAEAALTTTEQFEELRANLECLDNNQKPRGR